MNTPNRTEVQIVPQIKMLNKVTGEMIEVSVGTLDEAREAYELFAAFESAAKKAKADAANRLLEIMGDQQEHTFMDGKKLKINQTERRTWTPDGLRKIGISEETILAVSKIDMRAAKALVVEKIERGEIVPNAGRILDDNAERSVTKPFPSIR